MALLRPIILLILKFDINLKAKHIPGLHNVLCDRLSRFQVSKALLDSYNMNHSPTPVPQHLRPHNLILK